MPNSNKKLLTEQLALILAKYQSKFSIEFRFFVGLIILYAPMTIGAVKMRKQNTVQKARDAKDARRLPERKVNEAYYKHTPGKEVPPEPEVAEVIKEEKIVMDEIKVGVKKRGPGRQKKSY